MQCNCLPKNLLYDTLVAFVQVVGSIQYTNDLDVHIALITAVSYAKVCTVFLFCIKPEQMNSNL